MAKVCLAALGISGMVTLISPQSNQLVINQEPMKRLY
jgi:hypothetical protein